MRETPKDVPGIMAKVALATPPFGKVTVAEVITMRSSGASPKSVSEHGSPRACDTTISTLRTMVQRSQNHTHLLLHMCFSLDLQDHTVNRIRTAAKKTILRRAIAISTTVIML